MRTDPRSDLSVTTHASRALASLLRWPARAHHDDVEKLRFLVVEDSVPMRRLMCSLLADIASEVVECGGGHEAVRLYFESRPDWVLMDLHMPDGDGLEATREIRGRDGSARIVIVTQFDDAELRRAAAEAGAVAYMLKENLLTVRKLVSRM